MIDRLESDRNSREPRDVWFPLLILTAGILFFSDVLFSSKNFYFRDILNFHYPLRRILIESYARGEFPLWNPYVYLGQPMLANPNYMAFYPTNLFHLILPFNYAFKLHFIVHPLLGGLGLYFLQRRLGIPPTPSLGGALVYQFSGPVLSFLNLYNIVPAVALMPWTGWSFLRAVEERSRKSVILLGAILGLQFTAFEPLMFQCSLILIIGLAFLRVFESGDRQRTVLQVLSVGFWGMLFGVALAAIQIVPTLELLPRSARLSGYDFNVQARWSMHPADFLNTVVPNLFGTPYTMYRSVYWGESFHDARESYLVSFFVGSGAVLVAALSALSARRKLSRTLIVVTILSSLLALGKHVPIYLWMYEYLPFFRLGRYPSKFFLLGVLCIAILCSLGLELLLNAVKLSIEQRRRILAFGLIGLVAALLLIGIWVHFLTSPAVPENLVRSNVSRGLFAFKDFSVIGRELTNSIRLAGLFLLLSSALVCLSLCRRRIRYLGALLALTLGAELAASNLKLTPLISDRDFDFSSEVNAYLENSRLAEADRVVSLDSLRSTPPTLTIFSPEKSWAWFTLFYRMSGQPMYGIMHGIQYSFDQTVDYLNTMESEALSKICATIPDDSALSLLARVNSPIILSLGELRDSRLKVLESFDSLATSRLKVYLLEESLPRAYFAGGVEWVGDQKDAMERFLSPDHPYESTVILEGRGSALAPSGENVGRVRILDYQYSRVLCEVESSTPGVLVLLDSYYPGWSAYVNGEESEIMRANYAFRAVALGAGRHQVEFLYRPRSFFAGLSITSVALLCGTIAVFWNRKAWHRGSAR